MIKREEKTMIIFKGMKTAKQIKEVNKIHDNVNKAKENLSIKLKETVTKKNPGFSHRT